MLAHPVKKLSGGHGACVEEPLAEIATQSEQQFLGGLGLDAFGDHLRAEFVGKLDGQPHDRAEGRVFDQWADQREIELDQLDWQISESAQRGVTGPEVVDRDLHPQRMECRQHSRAHRFGRHALGDFDDQQRPAEAVFGQPFGHAIGKLGVGDALRRDVDRERHAVPTISPTALLAKDGIQHQLRQS